MTKPNRREFLKAAAIAACPEGPNGVLQSGAPLVAVGEIRRTDDGVLRATILVEDELRAVWVIQPNAVTRPGFREPACREKQAMRYFAGGPTGGKRVAPAIKGVPGPGPTLRARMGDQVQITLLNHVDVKNFPDSLDLAERGRSTGCDSSVTLQGAAGQLARQEVYPAGDQMPNCFHGSSSANLHFHGFHVSPSGIQDNVLVQVRPSPRDPKTNQPLVSESSVDRAFRQIFSAAAAGKYPEKWEDMPLEYRRLQERLVREYDRQVPLAKLGEANRAAVLSGQWPPYFVGAYPNSFRIAERGKPTGHGMPAAKAGQAPGLHWYHSHKHGSTALNSFNGMAGAFVVEGDYDDKIHGFYGPGRLEEKILVMQQYAPALNLQNTPPPNGVREATTFDPIVFVNGSPQPVIEMRPGQVQFWRMLNACGQQTIAWQGFDPAGFIWKQTAQDGIQFHWENFSAAFNENPKLSLSPANRADLLVKAPLKPGRYELQAMYLPFPGRRQGRVATVLFVDVKGEPVSPQMGFPSKESEFPAFPEFLADIDPKRIKLRREVTFDTQSFGPDGRPDAGGLGRGLYPRIAPARHTMDGVQFEEGVVNQVLVEGTEEEWLIFNTTAISPVRTPTGELAVDAEGRTRPNGAFAHPFHIHINPFQVVEIFDPVTMEKPQSFPKRAIWQDTIGVPPAYNYFPDGKTPRTDASGKHIHVPGYVKIRMRIDDFTGLFVMHCHILAHEDRGMMQLVQIVPGRVPGGHHH